MDQKFEIKDSGVRQDFGTGSVRDTREGKGRFDLIPYTPVLRLAQHYEGGAKKYGDRNWEKGQPLSRYLDSATRHLFAYLGGKRDEDHLIACAWNIFAYIETERRILEGKLPRELADFPDNAVEMAENAAKSPQPPTQPIGGIGGI